MARLKLGAFITDINGSLGGQTFQKSGSGLTLRNKPNNCDQQSQAQLQQRSIMLAVQNAWRALSDSQRSAWHFNIETFAARSSKDYSNSITGRELFLRWNCLLHSAGYAIVQTPDLNQEYNLDSDFTLYADNLSFIAVFDTDPTDQNKSFLVNMSRPSPSGYIPARSSSKRIIPDPLGNGGYDLRQSFEDQFAVKPQVNDSLSGHIRHFNILAPFVGQEKKFIKSVRPLSELNPGVNWNSVLDIPDSVNCTGAFYGENGTVICTCAQNIYILRSTDFGLSFSLTTHPTFVGGYWFAFYCGDGIWLACGQFNCTIVRSIDNGATWTTSYTNPSLSLCRQIIRCSDGSLVGCCNTLGAIIRSIDNGLTWSVVYNIPSTSLIRSICNSSTSRIYCIGRSPIDLYYSDDFGLTWVFSRSFAGSVECNSLYYVGLGVLIMSTKNAYGYWRSIDNGSTWSFVSLIQGSASIYSIVSINSTYLIATFSAVPLIGISSNAGASFDLLPPLFSQTSIQAIAYCGNGVLVAGTGGTGLIIRSSIFPNA